MRAITTNQIIQATMYECHTPNVVFKGVNFANNLIPSYF